MMPKSASPTTLKPALHTTSENRYHQHAHPNKKWQTQALVDVNVALSAGSSFLAPSPARLRQFRARCRFFCKMWKLQHCSLSLVFLRIVRALAQSVTDSFVQLGSNERGRFSTVAVSGAAADLWRDVST